MPIGKDSITKRVAKQTEPAPAKTEEKIAPELIATTAAAPVKKAPAKKSSSTTNKTASTSTTKKTSASSTTSAAKKPAAKKSTPKAEIVTETLTPPTVAPENEVKVETAVLANVSPETVAAVIGHNEKDACEIVQIGGKMPTHLL